MVQSKSDKNTFTINCPVCKQEHTFSYDSVQVKKVEIQAMQSFGIARLLLEVVKLPFRLIALPFQSSDKINKDDSDDYTTVLTCPTKGVEFQITVGF